LAESDQFPKQRLRFGPFEVDLRAGELWKAGKRRKLTGQPFSVLAILLERPGEVVTREELQKRLWPDTFVDVDHNLNTAINKIREALNDSSERPQFIETLSRRGYRFIAPVESVRPDPPLLPNGAESASSIASEAQSDGPAATTATPLAPVIAPGHARATYHSRFSRKTRMAGLSAIAIVALVVLYLLRPTVPPPRVIGMRQLTHDGTTKLGLRADSMPSEMFTDGTRVYFEKGDSVQNTVMQVSTMGGDSEQVPIPFHFVGLADLSVSQSKLLLYTPVNATETLNVLWTMPLPTGQPQSNGKLAVYDAAWSPDGDWLYYTIGSDLWAARNDESQPRKLLSGEGLLTCLRFSHDGQRIRFSAFDEVRKTTSVWEAICGLCCKDGMRLAAHGLPTGSTSYLLRREGVAGIFGRCGNSGSGGGKPTPSRCG